MKVAYFGFDLFYDCLEQIKACGHEIVKIFTCKVDGVYEFSDKVYSFAKQYNIEITEKKVEKSDIDFLVKDGCDLLFCAGYYYKIPVIDALEGVNIHPALLPNGRGPWPQPLTILKGLSKSGITLHKLSDKFDEGDVVLQKSFDVDSNENLETITQKCAYYAKKVTKEFFENYKELLENSIPQSKGEYWAEPSENDMTFNVSDEYEKIDSILRAFYGFKCTMIIENKKILIKKGKYIKSKNLIPDNLGCYNVDKGYVVVLEYAWHIFVIFI